jgi:predicted O-linked N-acetylglucosamine transferase (SPINDLY family)
MDYRITDAKADPPGAADRLNVERLVRLPRSFLCYRPGPDLHEPGPPPSLQEGVVTFGCFNNFQKQSDAFFAAAARVLQAVPRSRLLLKARSLGFAPAAQRARERFAAHGIDASRLILMGWETTPENHLAIYQRVDIGLDSFPYNGTTTTCEALWMGVPVVTLAGDRHASRVGVSLLESVGLPELVGRDVDDYVRIAAALAGDLPRLAALRAGMRERLRASPLRDEAGFVRELEECYLRLWEERRARANEAPPTMEALTALWDKCHEAGEGAVFVDAAGRSAKVRRR